MFMNEIYLAERKDHVIIVQDAFIMTRSILRWIKERRINGFKISDMVF